MKTLFELYEEAEERQSAEELHAELDAEFARRCNRNENADTKR